MALQTNTNVKPYYDDWEENKNYHRVMFKAGLPVQARELTQSQTILQDQIEKLASRFLKNGDQVTARRVFVNQPGSLCSCFINHTRCHC